MLPFGNMFGVQTLLDYPLWPDQMARDKLFSAWLIVRVGGVVFKTINRPFGAPQGMRMFSFVRRDTLGLGLTPAGDTGEMPSLQICIHFFVSKEMWVKKRKQKKPIKKHIFKFSLSNQMCVTDILHFVYILAANGCRQDFYRRVC